jgi:flagellar biosynthesis protein FliP
MRNKLFLRLLPWGVLFFFCLSGPLAAAPAQGLPIPTVKIGVGEAKDPGEVTVLIQILILLTVLSLAPAFSS